MGSTVPKTDETAARPPVTLAYTTTRGKAYVGRIEDALDSREVKALAGTVDLLFTSPPFPLVRKKAYGNKDGEEYLEWLGSLAPRLAALLAPNGSLVIEVGNAWEKGSPFMSTLPLEALFAFKKAAKLQLCQHVICHNPARLPSPAQWVNVKRSRLKDSFTHVWWMASTEETKANNSRVLLPYGDDMKKLLATKTYNSGRRPSGHVISEQGFLSDHGGAISANVLELDPENPRVPETLLKMAGTSPDREYRAYCDARGLPLHPARMQGPLAAFFIQFLTEEGDLVFDPFAGSNTTGAAAERLGRRWVSVEADADYAEGSKGRFDDSSVKS